MEEDPPQNQTLQKPSLRRPVRQFQPQQEERRERIKIWMAACLVIVAFSIDCFEMLLEWLGIGVFGLSTLLSVCATVIFWIWFMMLGVSFTSPKKLTTSVTTAGLEIIPGLDALFGFIWTAGIIILVLMTRAEDKGGVLGKIASAAQGKIKA